MCYNVFNKLYNKKKNEFAFENSSHDIFHAYIFRDMKDMERFILKIYIYTAVSKYGHSCNTPVKSIKGMIFIKLLIKMNGITDMWYDILNWIMSYSDADYSQED